MVEVVITGSSAEKKWSEEKIWHWNLTPKMELENKTLGLFQQTRSITKKKPREQVQLEKKLSANQIQTQQQIVVQPETKTTCRGGNSTLQRISEFDYTGTRTSKTLWQSWSSRKMTMLSAFKSRHHRDRRQEKMTGRRKSTINLESVSQGYPTEMRMNKKLRWSWSSWKMAR